MKKTHLPPTPPEDPESSFAGPRPFFTLENVSAGYGHNNVLKNVSLSLQRGTLTGLLGANGCGKTTLLRTICGHIPHTGRCLLQGHALEQMNSHELARRLSYIPQRSGVTIPLPVLEVVLMGYHPMLGLLERPSHRQRRAAADALLEVGLKGMEGRDYLTLSEGQKQLCILARTLVEDTSVLLLDEPDSALDFRHRYAVLRTLRTLIANHGKAGLLCLHDPGLAFGFCDQILLMKDGRCSASLHPSLDSPEHMQKALEEVFGPVSLTKCRSQSGREQLVMLPDYDRKG